MLFVIFIPLKANFSETIQVKGLSNTQYHQAFVSDILKPQAYLNENEVMLAGRPN
jgi:hypothetical protein